MARDVSETRVDGSWSSLRDRLLVSPLIIVFIAAQLSQLNCHDSLLMRRRTLTKSARLPRLECSWTAADQSPLFSGIDHFGVSRRDRVAAAAAEENSRLERSSLAPEISRILPGDQIHSQPRNSRVCLRRNGTWALSTCPRSLRSASTKLPPTRVKRLAFTPGGTVVPAAFRRLAENFVTWLIR